MDKTVSSQNSFFFTLTVSEFSAFSKGYYSEKKFILNDPKRIWRVTLSGKLISIHAVRLKENT